MAINQKQVLSLQQKLSPQQIQMIKLLELPAVQLEQRIKQEIEENIVLEEAEQQNEEEEPQQISVDEYLREDDTPAYKMRANNYSKDDKPRQIPLSGGRSLQEYLIEQLGYRNLSEEEMRLAVYLVGSIDEDGYLRRDLESVADDIAFTLGEEVSPERLEAIFTALWIFAVFLKITLFLYCAGESFSFKKKWVKFSFCGAAMFALSAFFLYGSVFDSNQEKILYPAFAVFAFVLPLLYLIFGRKRNKIEEVNSHI